MKGFCLRAKSESEDCIKTIKTSIMKVQEAVRQEVKFVRHAELVSLRPTRSRILRRRRHRAANHGSVRAPDRTARQSELSELSSTIGRSMLHHAKLDKRFWAEAAMTAIYVKNRLPSPKIEHKTPFEIVYKSKPRV
ncbi:hypothetical protein Pcac1_g29269 [Phytophthora cactorum]|nr:hypothetical protein Pcac1_g29269 [Phytophthora cactorum]